ncbi:MAG: ATP-binding protein [Clostridiales bacterium]|nr:ATP-binding protein [Clostridiales bacterium]MDY3747679.1 ATP-binding protein [Lachnospiraceae bacterium]
MKKMVAESNKNRIIRWPAFYMIILLVTVTLVVSTVVWMKSTQTSSEQTVNKLGEFYLEEITERNAGNILSELERKSGQMTTAITLLDPGYLKDTESVQKFIYMVQKMNGLDMFALVDEDGMVYTADSTFSGISRFGFLSEEITETKIHMVKSYGTKSMVIISAPAVCEAPSNIHIVSCFSGLNIENVISAKQLQNDENKTYCRLFTKDGENLLNIQGEYQDGKKLFDILKETAEFSRGYSLEKFMDDWSSGQEGYAVYHKKDSGNTYVYYKPVAGTDLMLTSLMRESNINEVVEVGTRKMWYASVIYLIIVLISMAVLFIVINRVIHNAKKSQLENDQFKIVGTLSNDYSDIFLMEPLMNQSYTMKHNGNMVDYTKSVPRVYKETWENYVNHYVAEEDAERVLKTVEAEYICSMMKNVSEYTLDFKVNLKDGRHYYQTKFAKILGEDHRLIVGFRNIDAQMNAEKERQKVLQDALVSAQHANRAKTDFLSRMSHDIRTPLNGIIGLLEMEERHIDDRQLINENREKIKVAANHLNSLLNDILQLSKLEDGNISLSREVVNLNALAGEILTISEIRASERGITLQYRESGAVFGVPYVYGSPLHLRQIFLNILSNAVKYNKPGGTVTCKVECLRKDERNVTYSCTISDTGIGMSQTFIEHIFEPFSQERSDARSTYQGTGLGMSIVKSLVDKMGGTIEVKSTEGKGSTFVVTIPFEIAEASEAGNEETEETDVSLENVQILLVEDNELNMEIAQCLLEDAGASVSKAYDGQQAVDIFRKNPPGTFDVILMDVMMPVMNGIEAARTIRLLDRSDAQTIPVIAMTANAFEEDKRATKEAGMNEHLTKPLDGKKVIRVISKYSQAKRYV